MMTLTETTTAAINTVLAHAAAGLESAARQYAAADLGSVGRARVALDAARAGILARVTAEVQLALDASTADLCAAEASLAALLGGPAEQPTLAAPGRIELPAGPEVAPEEAPDAPAPRPRRRVRAGSNGRHP